MTPTTISTPLDTDELLHQLANERRRLAVRAVADQGPCRTRAISEAVAEDTVPYSDDERPGEHRHRIHISLLQSHLPKLTENGVLTEMDDNRYRLGPAGEQFLTVLNAVERAQGEGGADNRGVVTDGGQDMADADGDGPETFYDVNIRPGACPAEVECFRQILEENGYHAAVNLSRGKIRIDGPGSGGGL